MRDTWEEFVNEYVNTNDVVHWEFEWEYNGISYYLGPIENETKYEFIDELSNKQIFDNALEALQTVKIDDKTIKELYELELIDFSIG